MKVHNDSSDHVSEKNQKIRELEAKIQAATEKQIASQRELDYALTALVPKLKDDSKYQKEKIQAEFEQKEDEIRSGFIKQKYQLKE